MPTTYTYAEAKTRTEAVLDQFDIFLRYTGISDHKREGILKGIQGRWLDTVAVYLTNNEGKRILEAEINVNWKAHSDLAILSPTIRTDLPGWERGAAPEIHVIGGRFGKKAQELGSPVRFWVRFNNEIRSDKTRHKRLCGVVGVLHATSVAEWASKPKERFYGISELEEINVGLREA